MHANLYTIIINWGISDYLNNNNYKRHARKLNYWSKRLEVIQNFHVEPIQFLLNFKKSWRRRVGDSLGL